MGRVSSTLKKQVTDINVEEKAYKLVNYDKKIPAPRHPGTFNPPVDRTRYGGVDVVGDGPKIEELDKKLKDVYVTSTEVEEVDLRHPAGKPLPTNTRMPKRGLYGVHEPVRLTAGRTTVRLLQEMITKNQEDPDQYDHDKLAEEYTMKTEHVGNILKHFEMLHMVYKPEKFYQNRLDEGVARLEAYYEEEKKRDFKLLPHEEEEPAPMTIEQRKKQKYDIPLEELPPEQRAKEKTRRLFHDLSREEVVKRIPAPEESKDMRNVLPAEEKWKLLTEEEKVEAHIEGSEEQKFLEEQQKLIAEQSKLLADRPAEEQTKMLEDLAEKLTRLEDPKEKSKLTEDLLAEQSKDLPVETKPVEDQVGDLLRHPPKNMYKPERLELGHADRPAGLETFYDHELPPPRTPPGMKVSEGIKDEFHRLTNNKYSDKSNTYIDNVRNKIRTPNQPSPKVTTVDVRNPKRKKAANGD